MLPTADPPPCLTGCAAQGGDLRHRGQDPGQRRRRRAAGYVPLPAGVLAVWRHALLLRVFCAAGWARETLPPSPCRQLPLACPSLCRPASDGHQALILPPPALTARLEEQPQPATAGPQLWPPQPPLTHCSLSLYTCFPLPSTRRPAALPPRVVTHESPIPALVLPLLFLHCSADPNIHLDRKSVSTNASGRVSLRWLLLTGVTAAVWQETKKAE